MYILEPSSENMINFCSNNNSWFPYSYESYYQYRYKQYYQYFRQNGTNKMKTWGRNPPQVVLLTLSQIKAQFCLSPLFTKFWTLGNYPDIAFWNWNFQLFGISLTTQPPYYEDTTLLDHFFFKFMRDRISAYFSQAGLKLYKKNKKI